MIFEIVKEDNDSTVFQISNSLENLEKDFLKVHRIMNFDSRMIVYEVNEDFKRVEKLKEYDKYSEKDLEEMLSSKKVQNRLGNMLFLDYLDEEDDDGTSEDE